MKEFAILTEQQVALLSYVRQAIPAEQAIRMAGMDIEQGYEFLQADERGTAALDFSQQMNNAHPEITVDLLTAQLYEERARSSNSMEGVACLKEIGKLHGLYEKKIKLVGEGDDESQGAKSLKAVQRMSDDDIIKDLDREGVTIDLLPQKRIRDITPKD